MHEQTIMKPTIERFPSELPLPFSKVVRAGGFLFLSGQVATGQAQASGDIAVQTEAILLSISKTLAEHRSDLAQIVRASVWLSTLEDFPRFNQTYERFFAGHLPARSTVQARLAQDALVEIEVQAFVGEA